jgi:hypothetical protein
MPSSIDFRKSVQLERPWTEGTPTVQAPAQLAPRQSPTTKPRPRPAFRLPIIITPTHQPTPYDLQDAPTTLPGSFEPTLSIPYVSDGFSASTFALDGAKGPAFIVPDWQDLDLSACLCAYLKPFFLSARGPRRGRGTEPSLIIRLVEIIKILSWRWHVFSGKSIFGFDE